MIPRLQLNALVLLTCVTIGCGPDADDHNFGVGRDYSFTSFELVGLNGEAFELNANELKLLESGWFKTQIANEITISNTLNVSGENFKYKSVLNDGFTMRSEGNYGTVGGTQYLDITLLSYADAYSLLIQVDSVFSTERCAELEDWFEANQAVQDAG